MGYYYGFGAFNRADEWVNHHFSLPQGSPGREVLSNLLIKRYDNDVAKFNAVYGTSLKDMSELKSSFELAYEKEYERRNYPRVVESLDEDKLADFEAIVSHMCVFLYKLGHDAIHRWDDNHLILGSFIKEWALSVDSWKKAAPYVDMIAPQHINQDYPRYELHRVWVVDATLKEGARHIYKRRVFYVDEDSWQILVVDQYDNRDQLWRVSEGHAINYYDLPTLWTTLEVHIDLQAGRYLAIGLDNEQPTYRFGVDRTAEDFTPAALRRSGVR